VRSPGYRAEQYDVTVDTNGLHMDLDLADGSALRDPGIVVTPTSGLTTTEAGAAATFTVRLSDRPTAAVTFNLNSTDTSEGTLGISQITFTPQNWNVAQIVWVYGEDDFSEDGDRPYRIVLHPASSDDLLYDGINPADVSLTNIDDDKTFKAGKWQVAVNIQGSGHVYDMQTWRIDTRFGDHKGKYGPGDVAQLVTVSNEWVQWYVNGHYAGTSNFLTLFDTTIKKGATVIAVF